MLICKFSLISSNKSPTQCTSGSLDQNHRAVQTITSQNRFADFRNSSFPMILDPQTTADGVSFFVFSSVSSIFLRFFSRVRSKSSRSRLVLSDLFVLSLSFLLLQSLQQKVSKLLPPATLQFERRLFKCVLLLTQRFSNLLCADNFGDLWNLLNLWMINLRALLVGIPFRTRSGCRRSWSTCATQCYTVLHRATQCFSATATGESR